MGAGGTKRLRTAEKIETNRCNPGQDRKPCIIRSRFRHVRILRTIVQPLWERCSTFGMTMRLAAA